MMLLTLRQYILLLLFLLPCSVSQAQQGSPVYYTVQPQEGLYRVAVKNNVTMEQIRRWNNLTSDNLSLGQRLIVGYGNAPETRNETPSRPEPEQTYDSGRQPIYYSVQPQEGLYRVAVKNNVTMAEIRSWNNLTSDQLSVGQRLIVGYEIAGPEEEEEPVSKQALYEETLNKGNKAFEEQRYEDAKKYFLEALAINPDSYYGKKRLDEIEAILAPASAPEAIIAGAAAPAIIEEKKPVPVVSAPEGDTPPQNPFGAFWFYVKKGDAEMSTENYEAALSHYQEAAKIYPSKPYPKAKIEEIEALLKKDEPVTEPVVAQVEDQQSIELTIEEDPTIVDPPVESLVAVESFSDETETNNFLAANVVQAETYFAVLKSKPTDFGKVVQYLPENSEVTLLDFNGSMRNYYKVKYNDTEGWVTGRNIKVTKEVKLFKSKVKAVKKSSSI